MAKNTSVQMQDQLKIRTLDYGVFFIQCAFLVTWEVSVSEIYTET